nr:hypothetical protein [Candidatus Njordarchaeota archaeon]
MESLIDEVLIDRPVVRLILRNLTKKSAEKTEETPKKLRWHPEELAQELDRLVQEGQRIVERRRNGRSNGRSERETATTST